MSKQTMLQVGDVIASPKFAYGYYEREEDKKLITIDGKTKERPVTSCISEAERVEIAAKTGRVLSKTMITELGAYDQSRVFAKFVVESANMEGGGTGHGPHDVYPDGWHVQARRLNENGSYDPNGELIHFYMSGCFSCMVEPKDVKVVDRMQMRFV